MKAQYRSAVTLAFVTFVCAVIAILMHALRERFIASWFMLNKNVLVGLLSGLFLTLIISLGNLLQVQRQNAKATTAGLNDFLTQAQSFLKLLGTFEARDGAFVIPETQEQTLSLALARLDETTAKLVQGERVSPLKPCLVQKRNRIVSPLSKREFAFYQVFSPFAEHCHAAYHAHNMLPYLKEASEQTAARTEFSSNLRLMADALAPDSALCTALNQYQAAIARLLHIKRAGTNAAA